MTALVKYHAARHALAIAKQVDEVKDIRDKAEAMRLYGQMSKDKSLEMDAAEIRIRAERRLGEMIAAQKAEGGLSRGAAGSGSNQHQKKEVRSSATTAPTLASAGISKDLSSRAQAIAAVSPEQFEKEVGEWRDRVSAEGARVTTRLVSAGEKVIAAIPKVEVDDDFAPDISAEYEREVKKNTELEERVASLTASDIGAQLDREVKARQAAERMRDDEIHKNATRERELDELRKFRNKVLDLTGADSPKSALAWIRQQKVPA